VSLTIVSEEPVAAVDEDVPNLTAVTAESRVPRIVTMFEPLKRPTFGETDVMVGAGVTKV
jgi:hypothetical protein